MPSRQGSDIDGSKLKSLFCQLGFDVILRRNLIYTVGVPFSSQAETSLLFKEMISAIKNFAITIEENKDTSDCAVVIILSHGGNGTIYAVDELTVDVSNTIIEL